MTAILADMKNTGSITSHRFPNGTTGFRLRMTIQGVRRSLGVYETREEAEAQRELAAQKLHHDTEWTLRRWGAAWLDERETRGKVRGVAQERSCWRRHVEAADFIDWPLEKIGRRDVLRWARALERTPALEVRGKKHVATERRLSSAVVGRALSLLRCALRAAADEGHLEANVAADVHPAPPEETEVPWTFLTVEEIAAVLGLPLRSEQRAVFTLAIYTGLRPGELWGLRWRYVSLDEGRPELVVCRSYDRGTKTRKVRRVPLLPPALEALKAWHKRSPGIGDALVFPALNPSGRQRGKVVPGGMHGRCFDAGWGSAVGRAGIVRRVRFYDCRHTCASHLLMGSWIREADGSPRRLHLRDVQEWLGHSSMATTQRYCHLAPDWLHEKTRTERAPGRAREDK